MTAVTLRHLNELKKNQEKITMLTCYDASMATLLSREGVEVLLVGDSLGNVIQGQDTTLPVTTDEIAYHTKCVKQGNEGAFIIADMPFLSYASTKQAIKNASKLMKAGAQMVKLEGGQWLAETITKLSQASVPVCAHLGLQPQSVHAIGGYHVQGRNEQAAQTIIDDAIKIEKAGASMLVLECIPTMLAAEISKCLTIPVIGIGAGPSTDGQVLVLQDMLGITENAPRFARNFLTDNTPTIQQAVKQYINTVKAIEFPSFEESFT